MGILHGVDKFFRTQSRRLDAGVRSGLNKEKPGQWGAGDLFGWGQVKAVPGRIKAAGGGLKEDHEKWKTAIATASADPSKMSPQDLQNFMEANQLRTGWGSIRAQGWDLTKGAWGYFSGRNMGSDAGGSGWKRAGAIGARAGLAAGGVAAADFFNPFGLGWND